MVEHVLVRRIIRKELQSYLLRVFPDAYSGMMVFGLGRQSVGTNISVFLLE